MRLRVTFVCLYLTMWSPPHLDLPSFFSSRTNHFLSGKPITPTYSPLLTKSRKSSNGSNISRISIPCFPPQGSPSLTMPSSPQLFSFSPSSDKRFWNTLRSRVDTLLENRKPLDQSLPAQMNPEVIDRKRRMKEDSMLLLRGFDSVAQSLSLSPF
ncbi:hypothetical protein CASFOL_036519 [Castilleja foliolosa]|uniref:Uncharacterized protein n=1 Tax=Castilleja foliolosa TaxID=1961234 RepID=A0ABD3BWG8_9LAMI